MFGRVFSDDVAAVSEVDCADAVVVSSIATAAQPASQRNFDMDKNNRSLSDVRLQSCVIDEVLAIGESTEIIGAVVLLSW